MKIRSRRRFAGFAAMLVLLFAQLSLAAYACAATPLAHGQAAVAMPADCPGHHPAPLADALCGLHCQAEATVPSSAPPDVLVPAVAPLLVALPHPAAVPVTAAAPHPLKLAAATDPPVAIRYCRFLI
jgi:hypothetical protein